MDNIFDYVADFYAQDEEWNTVLPKGYGWLFGGVLLDFGFKFWEGGFGSCDAIKDKTADS